MTFRLASKCKVQTRNWQKLLSQQGPLTSTLTFDARGNFKGTLRW